MSRQFAAVAALILGLPFLAMAAVTASGGVKPDFLLTLILASVLLAFLVAGLFEIHRLIDVDTPAGHDSHGAHGHGPAAQEPAAPQAPAAPPPVIVAAPPPPAPTAEPVSVAEADGVTHSAAATALDTPPAEAPLRKKTTAVRKSAESTVAADASGAPAKKASAAAPRKPRAPAASAAPAATSPDGAAAPPPPSEANHEVEVTRVVRPAAAAEESAVELDVVSSEPSGKAATKRRGGSRRGPAGAA